VSFTVVDWNVNGRVRKNQPSFLGALDWDIACLQEITRSTWEDFQALGEQGDVAFGYLPPLADEGPKYGSAVLVRGSARREGFEVLPDVPSPERAAVARVTVEGRRAWVGSWAAPPAQGRDGWGWGKSGKGRQVVRFAAWLRDRPGPTLMGIDRNAPKRERHELADDEWWNKKEPLLYGPQRVHDLSDVYRDHLQANPAEAAQVRAERPHGPLAVTYRRGKTDCRYDAIYASPEFHAERVEHLWDEARGAGSDHALVRATLAWRPA
jgi:hypothetical protein